jgi:hypothetical protein
MTGSTTVSNPSDDFHIYTLDWNSKRIYFYLRSSNDDDIKFYCYKNYATGKVSWPFDLTLFILNIMLCQVLYFILYSFLNLIKFIHEYSKKNEFES